LITWLQSKITKSEFEFNPEALGLLGNHGDTADSLINLEEGKSKLVHKTAFPWSSRTPKASMSSSKLDNIVSSSVLNRNKLFQSTPHQPSILSLMKTQDKSIELPCGESKTHVSTVYTPRNVELILSTVRPLFKTQATMESTEPEKLSPTHKMPKQPGGQLRPQRQVQADLQGGASRKTGAAPHRPGSNSFSGLKRNQHSGLPEKNLTEIASRTHTNSRLPSSLVCFKETVKF